MINADHVTPVRLRSSPRVSYRLVSTVIVVIATLTVLASLVRAITIITGRTLFAFGGADGRLPLVYLPQLLQADLREGATGTLTDAALSLRLLGAVPSLVEVAVIAVAAVALLRVVKGVSRAEPFGATVLANWRLLTLALLGGGILQGLADTVANVYLSSSIGLLLGAGRVTPEQRLEFLGGDYSGIGVNLPQWPLAIIVAGLVALALDAAFRAGARLERDVDGVV